MATYTVYQPPLRGTETSPDPERFVFVRDGFRFWAMVLAPIWLIVKRLWIVLILYVMVTVALQIAVKLLTGSNDATMAVSLLVALLFGFEAASLQRWTLLRRKWKEVGVVVGDDQENAERRFFEGWVRQEAARPAALPPAPQLPVPSIRPASEPNVIGLFPEPGAPR